jgi:hypothetical protein
MNHKIVKSLLEVQDMEIITAEQAIENAKGLTFEKVWAALMESRINMEKAQEETRINMEKAQQESRKIMDDLSKDLKESQQETRKIVEKLSKEIGGVSGSLGRFTESMFSEGLWKKFEEYGIPVSMQSTRKIFGENKKVVAEADVFIENGEYAIPVEVKTNLSVDDINEHLERIELIRRYLDKRGDKRKLLGAVAGGVVPENVLKYAQKKGLFVLVQSGDSVTIAATPEGFKPREW